MDNKAIAARIIIGIILLTILIFGFMGYDTKAKHKSYLQKVIDYPEEYDGAIWQIGGSIVETDNTFVYVADDTANRPIKILKFEGLETVNLKLDAITVVGVFEKDGEFFIPMKVRVHKYLFLKYVVSFIGLFMFLYIFFKEWKLTLKGFKPRGCKC